MNIPNNFKSGYVAVIGRPNVGKSTLTNALLQFPLSIATAKPQTTRHRILGIHTEADAQIIFLDTPGLIEPKYKLQEWMVKAAYSALKDADIILLMTEAARRPDDRDRPLSAKVLEYQKPTVLAINKIDCVDKNTLLPLIDAYRAQADWAAIVPISALKQENLGELKSVLLSLLPFGPPFYPPDVVTEHPERFFVSELVREQIFRQYGEEVPFSTAVVIDEFRERSAGKDFIRARIVVERESQKKIVIGKGGQAIRNLGVNARAAVEGFLERQVYLELHVVVKENWRKNDQFLKEFGYDVRGI